MSQLIISNNKNHSYYAGVIFGIVILSVYAPVLFLDQTYLINNPISSEYLENQNKSTLFGIVADSDTSGVHPDIKLASKMISEGELPLWNPYVGVGYPLGADTTDHIFSPISLGFLLPVEFWDLPLLLVLWVAGFSTYLFLRNLGLNFASSICGGIFYMLAGNFTLYMSHPGPFVIMATPLILLSIDKTFKNKNPKYIILLSLSFGFSILGAHLQSLFLQFLLIVCYLSYRSFSTFLITKLSFQNHPLKQNLLSISKSSSRVILGLIGGLGLTSFFVFYVIEYIQNGILDSALQYGSVQYNTLSLATSVMPYILGNIIRTWTTNLEWQAPFGYSGVFVLFFAVLSIFYLKNKNNLERFTPIFFLLLSSLALMRLANVPVISFLHTLPIFNIISFGSYSGVLITFGFAVAAAFGINYLSNEKISKKFLLNTFIASLSIITILLIPVGMEFFSNQNLSHFIEPSDIQNYIIFQIAQAIFFLSIALVISLVLIKKTYLVAILPSFVLLELSLYTPFGLHPVWLAYKFLLIAISMVILLLFTKFFKVNNTRDKKIFWSFAFILIIGVFVGSLVISEKSPYGMPTRYDSFGDNDIVTYLKNNIDHQRMFSFEDTMRTDYNAGFDISSVGLFSSYNVNDYYTFTKKFLDEDQRPLGLGSNIWSATYGPGQSINKFLDNKKYFDFLGVKYIITQGYNFNTISYGVSGKSGNFVTLGSQSDDFYQTFVSPLNSIDSFSIYLFAASFEKNDHIVLTIDSVPYTNENHRTLGLYEIKNVVNNEFQIDPPISNAFNKKFKFSLHYPEASDEKFVIIYYAEKKSYDIPDNMRYYVNGDEIVDVFLPFAITPVEKNFPVPFNFHDIYINENLDAFPRAYLVHDFVTVYTGEAQDFLAENREFDLRNSVILESSLSEFELNNLHSSSYELDSVKISEFNENSIQIQTFSENDSILILTDVFYPGWRVLIDDEPSEILRANGLVRAVIVPEGSHTVEFQYVPDSFWLGMIISTITAILLVGVYVYSRKASINNIPQKI